MNVGLLFDATSQAAMLILDLLYTTTNLRFADDIDGLAGEKEEVANLVERLDKGSTAYGMEISAEKIKLTTNNTSGINTEIK